MANRTMTTEDRRLAHEQNAQYLYNALTSAVGAIGELNECELRTGPKPAELEEVAELLKRGRDLLVEAGIEADRLAETELFDAESLWDDFGIELRGRS